MNDNIITCNLTLDDIIKLADKVEKGNLSKIKIKDCDCEIVIEKESKLITAPAIPPMAPPVTSTAPNIPAEATAAHESKEISGNVVTAPIVGTFYSKPAPDKKPFVEVGTSVKKGDVLMIIESMKLMNEVQSDFDGVVKEILVHDGDAVEFDQPIMVIE